VSSVPDTPEGLVRSVLHDPRAALPTPEQVVRVAVGPLPKGGSNMGAPGPERPPAAGLPRCARRRVGEGPWGLFSPAGYSNPGQECGHSAPQEPVDKP
jgi:hypothetical protein